ncbi:MAG: RND efflux system, membrane fusion protein [uncultured Microvirga sp.]|uniref:RND efflux system, membrane fusion protein n=1 Tax=uncultured Microvirga sp. TaxID=412392 RepID=A0A6J4MCT9_9HYPH|nr:MAG: RND efflux system, membrane fusion protein [uncultured Microvirga sp.]
MRWFFHFSSSLLVALIGSPLIGPAAAQAPAGQAPPTVVVAKPVMKDIQDIDEFVGRFEAVSGVEVRARVQGYLAQIHFTDGALVKVGDPLFTIDQRPYRLAFDQAQAGLTNAQARLDFAQGDLDRAEALRRSGNITEQAADQRRQNYLTAQSEVNVNRAQIAEAQLNLEFTVIRSPLAGRISRRLTTEGNLVAANTTVLTTIVSVDPIYFYFDVDERAYLAYSRMLQQGMRSAVTGGKADEVVITLTDTTLPPRRGIMNFVDNRLDEASGTMRVRAQVPNPDGYLVPGLFGRIAITGSAPYRAALVPDEAIGTDQDRRIAMVVGPDGTVRAQPVRLGPRHDGYRVVRQGLSGDETIVVSGLQRARPGQKVTPQPTTLPPVRERDGAPFTPAANKADPAAPSTTAAVPAPGASAAPAAVPAPGASAAPAAVVPAAAPSGGARAAEPGAARPRPQ